MKKDVVFLFVTIVVLVLFIVLSLRFCLDILNLNTDLPTDEHLPGASLLALMIGESATWTAFCIGQFFLAFIGSVFAAIAYKISKNKYIRLVSMVLSIFFLLIAVIIAIGALTIIIKILY